MNQLRILNFLLSSRNQGENILWFLMSEQKDVTTTQHQTGTTWQSASHLTPDLNHLYKGARGKKGVALCTYKYQVCNRNIQGERDKINKIHSKSAFSNPLF